MNNVDKWPLILAGPILRRVETKLVAVWIALTKPAKVRVDVWEGSKEMPAKNDEKPYHSGEAQTRRIGDNLHIAVVMVKFPGEKALSPGKIYSYNVKFPDVADKPDLHSLGLLKDNGNIKKNLILGYEIDFLPSFALPPNKITELKILHGSCRRTDAQWEDGLAWIDKIISENRNEDAVIEAKQRPHQLFLTGDQIYADSVSASLLPQLIDSGEELLGGNEFLPTEWSKESGNKEKYWKANRKNFPPGFRDRLIDTEARFTSGDVQNHLISFGEYAAMYLYVWSNALWDLDKLEGFEDILRKIDELPPTWGAIFHKRHSDMMKANYRDYVFDEKIMEKSLNLFLNEKVLGNFTKDELKAVVKYIDAEDMKATMTIDDIINKYSLGNKEKSVLEEPVKKITVFINNTRSNEELEGFKKFFSYFKGWFKQLYHECAHYERQKDESRKFYGEWPNHVPTILNVRRALANIPTYMMADDHEVTDDWNLNAMWCNRTFTSPLGRTILRNGMLACALFQNWGNNPEKYARESYWFSIDKKFIIGLDEEKISNDLKTVFSNQKSYTGNQKATLSDKAILKKQAEGEWLLSDPANGNEFLIRKYGKKDAETVRVIGNPHAALLDRVEKLFPGGSGASPTEDALKTASEIDHLLGLDQARVEGEDGRWRLPENRTPPLKWHFSVEGPKHKVLVLDNRTRRSFVSYVGPLSNLSEKAMEEQIPPGPLPEGKEVLFVVAPLPIFWPSILEELINPLAYRFFDLKDYRDGGPNVRSGMIGTNPDAIEGWSNDPPSLEALLKRLAPYRQVVLLSGDVHYASSQVISYWNKDEYKQGKKPARFAQLISSGMRNIMPDYIQTISRTFPMAQNILRSKIGAERLGWDKSEKSLLIFKSGVTLPPVLAAKLNESPVLLPTYGWPKGTKINRDPDWAWRNEPVIDQRPEEDRPQTTQYLSIADEPNLDVYAKITAKHAEQMSQLPNTRQILFAVNLGMVTFEKSGETLTAIHDIYAVPFIADLKNKEPQPYELFTQHKIALVAPDNLKKPVIGGKL